jgi:hypothetical protein
MTLLLEGIKSSCEGIKSSFKGIKSSFEGIKSSKRPWEENGNF